MPAVELFALEFRLRHRGFGRQQGAVAAPVAQVLGVKAGESRMAGRHREDAAAEMAGDAGAVRLA